MKKILYFGGTGYIGIELTKALNKSGFKCLPVGKGYYNEINSYVNLDNLTSIKQLLTNYNPDIIIDGVRYKDNEENKSEMSIPNWIINSIYNINKKCKIIHLGSCAEYGFLKANKKCFNENDISIPHTKYGSKKLSISNFYYNSNLRGYFSTFLDLKIFNVYSENPQKGHFPFYLKNLAEEKNDVIKIKNPYCVRDYMHLNDLVKKIVKLIKLNVTGKVNVCSGIGITNLDFASLYLYKIGYNSVKVVPCIEASNKKTKVITKSVGCSRKLENLIESLS